MQISDYTSQRRNGLWTMTVTVTDNGTSHTITGYECLDQSICLDSCTCTCGHGASCAHRDFAREGLNATAQAAYAERQARQTAIELDDNRRALDNLAYYLRYMVGAHIAREEAA